MRKLLAYILFAVAIIGTVAGTVIPAALNVNLGSEFRSGRGFVYQITNRADEVGNINPVSEADGLAIAQQFRDRLTLSGVDTFNVTKDGSDNIRMEFAADAYKFGLISRFVNFSPEFTIATSKDGVPKENVFQDGMNASFVLHEDIPRVLIPLKQFDNSETNPWTVFMEEAKNVRKDLNAGASIGAIKMADDEMTADSRTAGNLIIWNHMVEGSDTLEIAGSNTDPRVKERVFAVVPWGAAEDGSDMFYPNGKNDTLMIDVSNVGYDGLAGISGENPNQVFFATNWLVNMFNASQFKFGSNEFEVKLQFSGYTGGSADVIIPPSTEALLVFGSSHLTIAWSSILICMIVAFVFLALILAYSFRLGSLASIAVTMGSVFLTFALFVVFAVELNFAAILGLIVTLIASVFGQLIYFAKLKKEFTSGKTLKKSHSEAARKSIWPTIDIGIVQIIAGILFFFLGGKLLVPFGVIMIVGGFLNAVFNIFAFRGLMSILTGEHAFQNRPSLLRLPTIVNQEEVRDVTANNEEVKAKGSFRKKGPVLITVGLLFVSIIGLSVVGALNDGNVLNNGSMFIQNSRLTIRIAENDTIINSDDRINDALSSISFDDSGESLSFNPTFQTYKGTVVEDVEGETTVITKNFTFFVVLLNARYDGDEISSFNDPSGAETLVGVTLNEAIEQALKTNGSNGTAVSTVRLVSSIAGQPDSKPVLLAMSISILVCALYIALRYRPSRGIASLLVTSAASLIPLAFFSLSTLTASPTLLLSVAVISILVQLMTVLFATTEKDSIKDLKIKHLTQLQKSEVVTKTEEEVKFSFITVPLAVLVFAIPFIAFGPAVYASLFAATLAGAAVLGVVGIYFVFGPTSLYLNRFFRWFWNVLPKPQPKPKKRKKNNLNNPEKTAEPQEAIFIGINDAR